METIYQRVKTYLEKNLYSRERKNRSLAIVDMLIEKYPFLLKFPKERLIVLVKDYESYNRLFRKCQSECPELQGEDYSTKKIVEQRKQIELGYESGFFEITRKLKKLC